MPRPLQLATLLAIALFLPACLERKESAMLNPDGSGKAVIDTLVPMPPTAAGIKADPASTGKQIATQIISRARALMRGKTSRLM